MILPLLYYRIIDKKGIPTCLPEGDKFEKLVDVKPDVVTDNEVPTVMPSLVAALETVEFCICCDELELLSGIVVDGY